MAITSSHWQGTVKRRFSRFAKSDKIRALVDAKDATEELTLVVIDTPATNESCALNKRLKQRQDKPAIHRDNTL